MTIKFPKTKWNKVFKTKWNKDLLRQNEIKFKTKWPKDF